MTVLWIIGAIVVVFYVIGMFEWAQKTVPSKGLIAHSQAFAQEIFPNGKADHDAGASMIHEIMERTMPLDECRDVFIKAATAAHMGANVMSQVQRLYGSRLDRHKRSSIAGYIAIRTLAMETGDEFNLRRHPSGVIMYDGAFYDPAKTKLVLNPAFHKE